MEKIIGRKSELDLLSKYYDSDRPEFIVLYGRRRVGKTFIVRNFFKDKFDLKGLYYLNVAPLQETFVLAILGIAELVAKHKCVSYICA